MEYVTIKEISAKFAMPERTVYYNLAKNPNVRTKKQGRTKLIHIADFAAACGRLQEWLQTPLQSDTSSSNITNPENDVASLQVSLQQLQQEHALEKERMLSLQKVNTNLETDRNKFIQLYTEEKHGREDLRQQYTTLQQNHHQEIQRFLKKYYLVLSICGICMVLLVILNSTPLLTLIGRLI